jgi:hypothetical protein
MLSATFDINANTFGSPIHRQVEHNISPVGPDIAIRVKCFTPRSDLNRIIPLRNCLILDGLLNPKIKRGYVRITPFQASPPGSRPPSQNPPCIYSHSTSENTINKQLNQSLARRRNLPKKVTTSSPKISVWGSPYMLLPYRLQ